MNGKDNKRKTIVMNDTFEFGKCKNCGCKEVLKNGECIYCEHNVTNPFKDIFDMIRPKRK